MKKLTAIIASGVLLMTAVLPASAANIITGGDMTEVSYIESLGGVYKDFNGNKVDPFEFMAEQGVNMARIRLSNTTGQGTGDGTYYLAEGFQDEDDCLALAKRAKKAGMGIQFTFNYSDYWSNGERQIIPSEWVKQIKTDLGYDVKDAAFLNSMTSAQKKEIQDKLGDILYDYTKAYMQRLAAEDIYPEYVSLGNEINGGMFFPFANTYKANMNKDCFQLAFYDLPENEVDIVEGRLYKDPDNDIICAMDWDGLANILNRGYDAVKEVSPDSQIVIHLAEGSKDSTFTWFFDSYKSAGGKFDVIGASYYPAWSHNTIETCASFCKNISARYDRNILIMETGYNWTLNKKNGYGGQLTPTDSDTKNAEGYEEKYPYTPEGQKNYLTDLFTALSDVECRCDGVLYWDPCMIHVEDPTRPNYSLSRWAERENGEKEDNVVENTTLFDFDGVALPAFDAFNINKPRADLEGSVDKSAADKITATVTSSADSTISAKATLIVVTYENNILKSVRLDSKDIAPNSEISLEVEKPAGEYTVYLWNGNNLSPIKEKE